MQFILFTLIGMAVAYGIHRASREAREIEKGQKAPFFSPKAAPKETISAQDMMQCSVCQAFVVKNASHCGRGDCPYPASVQKENA